MFSFSGLDLKTRSGFGSWGVFKQGWRWSESEHLYSVWIITIGTQAKIEVTIRSVFLSRKHPKRVCRVAKPPPSVPTQPRRLEEKNKTGAIFEPKTEIK